MGRAQGRSTHGRWGAREGAMELSPATTQLSRRWRFSLAVFRRLRTKLPSPRRQIECHRIVRRTARLVAPSRAGIRCTAVECAARRCGAPQSTHATNGQRAPDRRLQVPRAGLYHPKTPPPLPRRARPRAAGDDWLLLARTSRCTTLATLAPRPWRAALCAQRPRHRGSSWCGRPRNAAPRRSRSALRASLPVFAVAGRRAARWHSAWSVRS